MIQEVSVRQKDETVMVVSILIFIFKLTLCLQMYGLFKGQRPAGVQTKIC